MDPARVPVVVGVGQVNDRPADPAQGLDSLGLMTAAARAAEADAGAALLRRCDWLGIVPQISFPALDTLAGVPASLGISPRHAEQAAMPSGDTPVRYLNDAANAIAEGRASVALIVGGEALRTAAQRPPPGGAGGIGKAALRSASALRRRYGAMNPVDIYPLYENATRAAWGQTLAQAQAETGLIWSLMSRVASGSPGAWIRKPLSAEAITTFNAENRPIAFPYGKLMVANSSVNQGAALLLASLQVAREAGLPESRLAYPGPGAAAHEPDDPLARARWDRLEGMRVSIEQALSLNGVDAAALDCVELYSCFPCVPKMSRRILGWPAERPATVHGGLTFGGGPIGNYMTHAAAAMVGRLRSGDRRGLLFANGGHCTHNHSIVLHRDRPAGNAFPRGYDFQDEADAARGSVPALTDDIEGRIALETYTVVHDRSGAPQHGIVLGRDPAGRRVIARVAKEDTTTIDFLTDGRREPVGSVGIARKRGEHLDWRIDEDRHANG